MRNKLIIFCLMFLLLTAFPLPVAAQAFEPDRRGSISVVLASPDGAESMEGAELSVFYVATVGTDANGTLFYAYTNAFADCGVELDDPELVSVLESFVSGKEIASYKIVTDPQGKAICEDLPLGLYFVLQTGEVEGFAPCTPFLVTVPFKTEDGFVYDVDATPKTDVERLISITIKKIWNTDKSTAVPISVTVQLLRHDQVIHTAILNKQNHWQITYDNLPESDGYRIQEVNVPKGFTATYKQSGYEFTVTNTASLAQTGQLIWPIPVFALAGIVFLMMGFVILRKPRKEDA